MKASLLTITLTLGLAAFAPILRAELSPISVRVEQLSDDKRTRFDESQKKTLVIYLTNSSAQDQSVKLKYYYFGKDVKDHAVIVLKEGEKNATVKAHGDETVKAAEAVAQSTEKHREGGGNIGRNHINPGGKEVNAGGQHIVGYGVQVFQSGKVTTDYFSEPSLKSYVGSGDR